MGIAVGIDLGTTYTAVACMDDYHKPVIIHNLDGRTTTPSVVLFEPPHYIVGEVALQSTLTEPESVAQFVKRSMGHKDQRIHIGGHSYSPEFVSSLILRKVVQDAETTLGEQIDSAVITVPAYFTEAQRQATIEAGEMAGLKVLRIINEPTAAALSYGMAKRGHKRHILVYDLGGGTFDITILRIDQDTLDVVAVGGDPHLGGKDFDDRIINYIEDELFAKYSLELENDRSFEAELRLKAEAAKRQLSLRQMVPVALKVRQIVRENGVCSERMVPVRLDLTREKFEEITADLLARTEMLLERVMQQANLEWEDISEVLCVGGSSRMPMVQTMLAELSGKSPQLHDPDECVAKGAAFQAALLQENVNEALGSVHVGHVLSHSLGVAAIKDGHPVIDHVIPSLTSLPCIQKREGYTTVHDNQTSVLVHIYEGESDDPEAYASGPIGTFQLDASPPRPKGRPRISVEFKCDENGRVTAIARDMDTGKESRSHITLAGMRNSSEANEEAELLAHAIVA